MRSSYSARAAVSASSEQKIRISKRELEQLVEEEVACAIKKEESNLDALIKNIQQQLGEGLNYEASIKTLQVRMMAVTQRAEEALAHIAQNPTLSLGDTSMIQSQTVKTEKIEKTELLDPDNVTVSSVSEFMEKTTKNFERLHADNAALKAAFEDIKERTTPSPKINVFEGLAKLIHIKKEPAEHSEDPNSSLKAIKRIKEEPCSAEVNRQPKRIKSEPEEVPYPPLPPLPFPYSIPLEAAKYNMPPRVKVDFAMIKNPSPQLSLVWSQEQDEPNNSLMDTYSIYITTEVSPGTGVFDVWQKLVELTAEPLPMFYTYVKFKPGHKICVSVVGKDTFGRYGPHSKVTCANL
ncbi:activating transcription factor 7-interacting protein 2-like [Boleophthalmus pectinirostris]|uniref:activating transcription factor 7-interacting protein 2-like n=1 Tax=Boleophthalmus pectinirostris TaxID=150288 RepID=UPI00242BFE67|nr:activating transcription factor 7-interacting protein 2-like [Boleophthalmus pectinirostris]